MNDEFMYGHRPVNMVNKVKFFSVYSDVCLLWFRGIECAVDTCHVLDHKTEWQ